MKKTVNLICLAPETLRTALYELLRLGNYDHIELDANRWLRQRAKEPNAHVIVFVADPNPPIELIVRAILAVPSCVHILVYASPLKAEYQALLEACDDFCSWPCDPLDLDFRLQRLSARKSLASKTRPLELETTVWKNLNLIGKSALFLDTVAFIQKASVCDAPVLIEGETGCGKEVAARAIHYLGKRKEFPFIPMNCGAIPDHLFENELFGHEKGAYTDAKQSQQGLTEQAHRGTLFLDEIEALSLKGQVTLLRFIEDKTIRPLGSKHCKTVDVKIIAASNINLRELVDKGLFRQDLLFRLNLLQLDLPPLRQRKGDIPLLAQHFIEKYREIYRQPSKRLHPNTLAWMNDHSWPGNIRELENFVHRAFLLSSDAYINSGHPIKTDIKPVKQRRILIERRQPFAFDAPFNEAKEHALTHFEQRYLTWVISHAKGNVTQAAGIAQKERRALGKLLKKHAINPLTYRSE